MQALPDQAPLLMLAAVTAYLCSPASAQTVPDMPCLFREHLMHLYGQDRGRKRGEQQGKQGTFLKSAMRPSLLRVPSGKKSTEAPFASSARQSPRHLSWLRLSMRFSITCPAARREHPSRYSHAGFGLRPTHCLHALAAEDWLLVSLLSGVFMLWNCRTLSWVDSLCQEGHSWRACEKHAPAHDGDEEVRGLGHELEGPVQVEQREDVLKPCAHAQRPY